MGVRGRDQGQAHLHDFRAGGRRGDEHLRILALLSQKLMDTAFRGRLAGAADEAAVLEVLREIQ